MIALLLVVRFALFIFMLLLLARVVLSLVIALAHDWRPKGAGLVATEGVFTATDPPLKALRKVIKPITIGQFRLDLAFLVLFISVSIALNIVGFWIQSA